MLLFHNFFLTKNVIFEENKIVSDTTSLRRGFSQLWTNTKISVLFMGVPLQDMSRYHLKRVLNNSHEQFSQKKILFGSFVR